MNINNLTIIKEALIATCPGDIRRLLLDCRSMAIYRQIAAIQPEYDSFLSTHLQYQQFLRFCIWVLEAKDSSSYS